MTLVKHPYAIGEPVLQVKNLSKRFGDNQVLRDINFEIRDVIRRIEGIEQGQVWSILGRSGRGKTTMARIIAGLRQPTTGDILINSDARPVKRGEVGFVFQDYRVFNHLTVLGNLLFAAYQGMTREHADEKILVNLRRRFNLWHFGQKSLRDKVDQYLDLFGLEGNLGQYPCELSGGQKQRLAIFRQVLCSSQFIVLDEPFSGQDPVMKQNACEMIIKVSRMGELKTLIIITHDVRSAVWVSDTLLPLGLERDETGKLKPGSTVFKPCDLAAKGLAWQDASICRTPEFNELVQEIEFEWFPNM